MPNLRILLTEARCRNAKPECQEYALRDLHQPSLTLRIRPTGSKTWVVRRYVAGKQVRVPLGAYPKVCVKAARQATNAILSGQPELLMKLRTASFATFQVEHERRHGAILKPSGLRTYRSYMRTQILPTFGGLQIGSIGRIDVMRWFERYSLRSPGGANRALGILGQMIECAKAWGTLPAYWTNPVVGIRQNRRAVVGTFLSEAQLARLGAVLAERTSQGCVASAVLHFLTLTGCRISEAVRLQWQDVSEDRLRLRDSKTGARDVPLGAAARRFLLGYVSPEAPPLSLKMTAPVFSLPSAKEYESVRAVWLRVRREADLPRSLRIHDLRHSFASHAIMSGETLFAVSRLLGHSRVQTTARYAHLADETLTDAAERIGRLIMAQINSRQSGVGSKTRGPRSKAGKVREPARAANVGLFGSVQEVLS